jgi:hypothetical protein
LAKLQTINQINAYLTTAAANNLTIGTNVSGGGLTLTVGLQFGLGTTGSGQSFTISGTGLVTIIGTIRGNSFKWNNFGSRYSYR